MKLELKHLAPYLPYGLELQLEIRQIEVLFKGLQDDGDVIHGHGKTPIKFVKPILRPLSDLTGKSLEVVAELMQVTKPRMKLLSQRQRFDGLPYMYFVKLFESHYDVFGLIPQGLAIDINTLK